MGDHKRNRRPVLGDYMDWVDIDYREPQTWHPERLLSHLSDHSTVLDVGCHTGTALYYLIEHNPSLLLEGVDLNVRALTQAKLLAEEHGYSKQMKFTYGDILEVPRRKQYHAVMLTRILTCFTNEENRQRLMQRCWDLLVDGGLLYVRDYVLDPTKSAYQQRYQRASELGWPKQNVGVYGPDGSLQFVVHHHTREEILQLTHGYQVVENVAFRQAKSMHRNDVLTFDWIGRRSDPNTRDPQWWVPKIDGIP